MPNSDFYFARCVCKLSYYSAVIPRLFYLLLYTHSIENQPRNTMVVFKMCDSVPIARDIPAFSSSLLIESQGCRHQGGFGGFSPPDFETLIHI